MYEQTAQALLKNRKPLKHETPENAATTAAEMANERESEIMKETMADMGYDYDPRKLNMARMMAREVATAEMAEFLDNLESV